MALSLPVSFCNVTLNLVPQLTAQFSGCQLKKKIKKTEKSHCQKNQNIFYSIYSIYLNNLNNYLNIWNLNETSKNLCDLINNPLTSSYSPVFCLLLPRPEKICFKSKYSFSVLLITVLYRSRLCLYYFRVIKLICNVCISLTMNKTSQR